MTTNEVRDKYLNFFKNKGHKIIPAAPLVLESDPTTLFTTSGMQPLVPYLIGEPHPEGKRVCNSQPAIRLLDIDDVGDNRHTTYFEMLGNWSFGDYFKAEQLPWIWEFLTSELKLPKEKLYVSIFEGNELVARDSESYKIWCSLGVPKSHIFEYGVKKNWWSRSGVPEDMPIGEIGGPDSEIFFDFGKDKKIHENSKYKNEKCHPNCDCGRFMEIGNSVFIQYKKIANGGLSELPQKNVDFGGGLERLVAATNNDPDVFKIDVFNAMLKAIEEGLSIKYGKNFKYDSAIRIILDHIRASVMLILDGVTPGNKQHGYVLRRLLRRASVKFTTFSPSDFNSVPLICNIANEVLRAYDKKERGDLVEKVISDEIAKFDRTLDKGLREFKKLKKVDGKAAFDLYQTYGFPLEITLELAREKGQEIESEEFRKAFASHQAKSRTASAKVFKGGLADNSIEVIRLHTAHHLILAALQKIVDPSIVQKGSNITAERLRMDFNFSRKLTSDEIKKIEDLVNKKISENLPVYKKIMPKKKAEKIGAQMEFNKKYPENVIVYFIGPSAPSEEAPFSVEFCGGPHVSKLSEIGGRVKIKKEESVSFGIRRIYAVIE